MKVLISNCLLFLSLVAFSQTTDTMEFNNVSALINTNGHFFNNLSSTSSGYEIPKGSGTNAIFSNSFWFGGTGINQNLNLAAQKYDGDQDFWTGPLSTFGGVPGIYGDANITAARMTYFDQIWKLSKVDIQNHIQNYNATSYVPIPAIATWPAHGDPSLGEAYNLAPFVDVNFDGVYEPLDGDYPEIRGDQAAYMILNDKGGIHSSGGDPIGLELHIMTYQYSTDDFLDNTTFVNIRYINRGTQTISDFKFANFLDVDLGDGGDDFMGTNTVKNLVYAYNGTNTDAQYGSAPPAIGVMSLCSPIYASNYFSSANSYSQLPTTAAGYYGFMNAQWGSSGSPFTQGGNGFGGATAANFIYDDLNLWSELSELNIAGDRNMLMTIDPISDGILRPGYQGNIDLAFIYGRDTSHTASAEVLFDIADSVQSFFNSTFANPCEEGFLAMDEIDEQNFENLSLYPNPSHKHFSIVAEGNFDLEIYDISGKRIIAAEDLNANDRIETPNAPGAYLVKITQNRTSITKKLIVQ